MFGVILLFGLFLIELTKLTMQIHTKYNHFIRQQQASMRSTQRQMRRPRRQVARAYTNTRQPTNQN